MLRRDPAFVTPAHAVDDGHDEDESGDDGNGGDEDYYCGLGKDGLGRGWDWGGLRRRLRVRGWS